MIKKRKKIKSLLASLLILALLLTSCSLRFYEPKKFNNNIKEKKEVSQEEEINEGQSNTSLEKIKANNDYSQDVLNKVSSMKLEEKIAQLFIITPEQLTGYVKVTRAGATSKEALEKNQVGGLIYFSDNLENPNQIKEMLANTQKYSQEIMGLPIFLAIDEEGGRVARLANNEAFNLDKLPSMGEIGKSSDFKQSFNVANTIGKYLNLYGFNLNFAPVADILSNPENKLLGDRSFSKDPVIVSKMCVQYLNGLKANNIMACYKHFPGHGASQEDSHEKLAYVDKTIKQLEQEELIPFTDGIENGIEFIMSGHIVIKAEDDLPASLSKKILTDLLREKMNYQGIIITDAMNMGAITDNYSPSQAAILALQAGNDMILLPQNYKEAYDGILRAVKEGEISEVTIDNSLKRILSVKEKIK